MYTPGLTGSKQPLRVCRESLTLVSVSQDQPNMNENTLETGANLGGFIGVSRPR